MNKLIALGLAVSCGLGVAHAQTTDEARYLGLDEYISMARGESPAAVRADTRRENRYWQYRSFQSQYRPQLVLRSDLPQYSNTIRGITQEDGSIAFRPVNQNETSVSMGLEQVIPWTGGTVNVSSSLTRFDNFTTGDLSYSSSPFFISIVQPVFAFNRYKWDRSISPMVFEESKRSYREDVERISVDATGLYFDLLLAQKSFEIAKNNVANNDTVFKIAQGRYRLGKIPENDLLQLELNLMNSQLAVSQAELDLETSSLALKSYVGIAPEVELLLTVPQEMPEFDISMEKALDQALSNRQEALAFERRIKEAERDVANARGDAGVGGDFFATFGFAGQGQTIAEMMGDLQPQTVATLGLRVPIMNGGRIQAVKETAEANQRLTEYTVAQDRINFEQEVRTQVRQFEMLRERVKVTKKSDEIAQRRYDIAKNRYLIGKISITDLSVALSEKDQAKRTYIESLRNLWSAYYNLRRLTLYDFENGEDLYVEEDEE